MRSRNPSELGWGLLLLVVGVVILLANFGLLAWTGGLWSRWWPLVLIAIGVLILINRREEPAAAPGPAGATPPSALPTETTSMPPPRRAFPTGAVILVGIGLAFLLGDYIGGGSFPALVLIAIGIALVLRERWGR